MALRERASLQGPRPVSGSPVPSARPPGAAGSNFDRARRYLEALNSGAEPEAIAAFYDAQAVQDEFPNRLLPGGTSRDLEAMKEARARGEPASARRGSNFAALPEAAPRSRWRSRGPRWSVTPSDRSAPERPSRAARPSF